MKNYKRLLLAGLAIVPLALSSWASAEPPDKDYKKTTDYSTEITKDNIGTSSVQDELFYPQRQQISVQLRSSDKVTKALEPVLTMNEILENYK
ncbi:hypothetical protein [Chryseobacterium sp.]|uniref:hypothetical protein n=1 Tax=Chryseobacterium sp. TaxID=1871047 RepID=UPI00289C033B|nr:hypothetical protein [Chryseobacterium sp.]